VLTPARRYWPLVGHFRRWGRYPSTCHRQKVTCGLRKTRTIGTSFNGLLLMTHTLALASGTGKAFFH